MADNCDNPLRLALLAYGRHRKSASEEDLKSAERRKEAATVDATAILHDLMGRISEAKKNVQPGSELDRVLERWKDHEFNVRIDDRWLLSGFIDWFQNFADIAHAVDPSFDHRLPRQCYDPRLVGRMFGIPIVELVQPNEEETELAKPIVGPVGKPGRKVTTADIAEFALVRREKEMSWKEIYQDWKLVYPDDRRVTGCQTLREAFRRHYRGKQ